MWKGDASQQIRKKEAQEEPVGGIVEFPVKEDAKDDENISQNDDEG